MKKYSQIGIFDSDLTIKNESTAKYGVFIYYAATFSI